MARSRVDAAALRELVMFLGAPPAQPVGTAVTVHSDALRILARLVPSDLVVFNDLAPQQRSFWAEACSLREDELPIPPGEPEIDFYDLFWTSDCSVPDRTGDFETVRTASDYYSTTREWRQSLMFQALRDDLDFNREMLLPLPSASGHSRRVRFIRLRGRDYDDTDRAVATLIQPHLVAYLHSLDVAGRGISPLTTRQRQLLSLVAGGSTNRQASRTLGITPATVRTHLEQIYARLGVRSRGEAVALVSSPTTLIR